MGCDEAKELIALLSGDDLSDGERVAVEAHLGECASCSAELVEYREQRVLLAGLGDGETPSGVSSAVWEAVRRERFGVRGSPGFRLLPYAALLLIGLSTSFLVTLEGRKGRIPVGENGAPVAETVSAPPLHRGDVVGGGRAPSLDPALPRRFVLEPTLSGGMFYLPRVRMVSSGGETDF